MVIVSQSYRDIYRWATQEQITDLSLYYAKEISDPGVCNSRYINEEPLERINIFREDLLEVRRVKTTSHTGWGVFARVDIPTYTHLGVYRGVLCVGPAPDSDYAMRICGTDDHGWFVVAPHKGPRSCGIECMNAATYDTGDTNCFFMEYLLKVPVRAGKENINVPVVSVTSLVRIRKGTQLFVPYHGLKTTEWEETSTVYPGGNTRRPRYGVNGR